MTMNLTPERLLRMFLHHIKLIVLITLLFGILVYGYSAFFISPTYSANALIMVQNYDSESLDVDSNSYNSSGKYSSSDITTSATMANNCVVLFQNSPDMTSLMDCSTYISLVDDNNNFIRITTSSYNPSQCAVVANNLARQAENCFNNVFEYGKLSVIREASVPTSPISPNVKKNTVYGLIFGLVFSLFITFFIEIIDTTIKPGDDLLKLYNVPVFAEVVDFEREG